MYKQYKILLKLQQDIVFAMGVTASIVNVNANKYQKEELAKVLNIMLKGVDELLNLKLEEEDKS
jgi:hypothetical protein